MHRPKLRQRCRGVVLRLRLLHSLHFKVAAAVFVAFTAFSTVHFIGAYRAYKQDLLNEVAESAKEISDLTLGTIVELAMLSEHPESLEKAVRALSAPAVDRTVRILDRTGIVRHSSKTGEIGQRPPWSSHLHDPIASLGEGRSAILRYVSPIPNGVSCRRCHEAREPVLGALVIDFSMAPIQSEIRSSLQSMLARTAMELLGVIIVLGLVVHRMVIAPVKRMTEATAAIARKQTPPSLQDLEGADEIGQLAESIRVMAEKLQDYCEKLEEKEKIRLSLLKRLIDSQEEERLRISRELHDQLGQDLTALLLHLGSRDARMTKSAAMRATAEQQVRALIDKVKRLAWEMRPSILNDFGLSWALRKYVEDLSRQSSVRIDYQDVCAADSGRLPSDVEITLYRVVQEALTNVIRHANANQASVVLMRGSQEVMLIIEDNGAGFDLHDLDRGTPPLGLKGMQERASLCDGELTLESARGTGTTVRVRIPLNGGKNGD